MDQFTRIRDGDREAFEHLVGTFQRSLVSFSAGIVGNREEAEDIVQDVFVEVWLKRKKIKFGDNIRNYLYISARFHCYNRLRASRNLESHLNKIKTGEIPDPLDSMVENEVMRILHETVESLPPRTAEVMKLTLLGYKQEEISRELDIGVTSVKTLKAAGIKKLKKKLSNLISLVGPFFLQ